MENLKDKCEVIYNTDVMIYDLDYVETKEANKYFDDITFGNKEIYYISDTKALCNDHDIFIDGDLYLFGEITFHREYCLLANVYVKGDVHIHGEIKFNYLSLNIGDELTELTDFLKVRGEINQLK